MDIKVTLPLLPLRDIVVFPSMVIPLFVGRDKSITALNEVMKGDKKIGEWMKNLEPEDLLKYGLIPEFIGRLPITATLDDLDEKSLVKILLEPKNSLIKQYQELFKLEGVKLTFKDQSVKDIANKAISKKTGARGLRSILENILLKTMFDLPSQDNIEEVIIDSGAAKGISAPVIVHSKNKTKTDKTSAA